MTDTPRNKGGRPRSPRTKKLSIMATPAVHAWLHAQEHGPSVTIETMVTQRMALESRIPEGLKLIGDPYALFLGDGLNIVVNEPPSQPPRQDYSCFARKMFGDETRRKPRCKGEEHEDEL